MGFRPTHPRVAYRLAGLIWLLVTTSVYGQTESPREWFPVCVGMDYARVTAEAPRPLRFHFLRIDLKAPGISFLSTPKAPDSRAHTVGMLTSTFLRTYDLQAAINAAPFGPIYKDEGKPVSIVGLTISEGTQVSPPTNLPVLALTRQNEASILEPPFKLDGIYTAVAGFSVVLRDGVVVGKKDALHPRTAAGVSRDGKTLWLMVVDGRQPGYSEGLTSAEIGAWLLAAGAWNGINLDGGGTSDMVIEDAQRTPRIMNLSINGGLPGHERVAGSHLGVRAQRLPDGPRLPIP